MRSPAHQVLAEICNRRRNSDIRADDKEVVALVDRLLKEIRMLKEIRLPEEIRALPDKQTLALMRDSFAEIARCHRCKSCAVNAQSAVSNLERFL